MFNRAAFWNTRPDGFGVLEVVNGEEGAARQFVPLRRTELGGEIVGPLAALRVVHTYGFTKADSATPIEALYRFPLPGDAAVTGVTVLFGETEIVAELAEREDAERRYAEAQERGESAALTTREAADLFTLRVTGLRPDEPIVVETRYVQLARPTATGWSIRVPLTTAPRYVREDERGARSATAGPLAIVRDPGHRFALDLTVRGGTALASPTHPLALDEGDEAALRVRLREGEVVPDRDFLLTWAARDEAARPALTVLVHDDPADRYRYFLALVAPPRDGATVREAARDVTLLVDHSGSMSGPKWDAADWATRSFLGGLARRDRFALGLFHDTTTWYARETRAATGEEIAAATKFLLEQKDSGGTNLGVALEQALGLRRVAGERARSLLIITDAAVSDAARILRLADEEARRPDRRRISILCIDASPNDALATELAERGGGISRFLTSAPEEDDITTALDEVLADWAAPIQTDLRLLVDRPCVELARGLAAAAGDGSALDLGDLPAGRAIWAVGRVPRDDRPLGFRLVAGSGEAAPLARVERAEAGRDLPALKALFGARRLVGLEYLMGAGYDDAALRAELAKLGYDADQVLAGKAGGATVYAENRRADTTTALRGLLVAEALHYGLATGETAFVAVRHEAGERVGASVIVPNALPSGWSPGFLGRGGSIRQTGGRMLRAMSFGGGMPAPAAPMAFAMAASPSAGFAETAAAPPQTMELFAGVPRFAGGEAVLFDSTAGSGGPTPPLTIARLRVRFPDGAPDPAALDPGLTLALYLDDLAAPRATVRLGELVRQGGERPLNLAWRAGQVLRLVLTDRAGSWAQGAPQIVVELG